MLTWVGCIVSLGGQWLESHSDSQGSASTNLGGSRTTQVLSELVLQFSALSCYYLERERNIEKRKKWNKHSQWSTMAVDNHGTQAPGTVFSQFPQLLLPGTQRFLSDLWELRVLGSISFFPSWSCFCLFLRKTLCFV
jgi:hypothetical protein